MLRIPTQTTFLPLPEGEPLGLAWPTPNRRLWDEPGRYFAATRANPRYGQPGWTRNCGRRFHRGCDIAPVHVRATGRRVTVMFSDCEKNVEYPSEEPVLVPADEVFAVAAGAVEEVEIHPENSDFGVHLVLRHRWPRCGRPFFTLYAHLASVRVGPGKQVEPGALIGLMGQTGRSAIARDWMAIAPHLHFEVWDEHGEGYDPAEFLRTYLSR